MAAFSFAPRQSFLPEPGIQLVPSILAVGLLTFHEEYPTCISSPSTRVAIDQALTLN